jgi:hypothetical protein
LEIMKRSTRTQAALGAVVTTLVFAAPLATAGIVTWGTPTDIRDDTDVRTNGTLVMAFNLGSAMATTVNGVTFQPFPVPSSATSATVGNARLSLGSGASALRTFTTGVDPEPPPALPTLFSELTEPYRRLLGTSVGSNGADLADNAAILTLDGLAPGQEYEFQAWFNISTVSGEFAYLLELWDLEAGLGNDSSSLLPNTQVISDEFVLGGLGQFVVGSFTASGATKSFGFVRGEVSGGLNGFQLRQVPPTPPTTPVPLPGTLALVGAALLAAGFVGRGRRAG